MKDIKKKILLIKIMISVLVIIDIFLVFFSIPNKQFIVLGIFAVAFILYIFLKRLQEASNEKSRNKDFKRKINFFHIGFVTIIIIIMFFLMIIKR